MSDVSPSSRVKQTLQELGEDVSTADGVTAEIHDDDSKMTPMLSVTFGASADRTEVLRTLFHADGPVAVDGVHSHRVVVRGE
jgi:hypothetical protein